LNAGLAAAKRAGGGNAGIAAFAQATGVSPETARRIVDAMFGRSQGAKHAAVKKSARA
jgi:hypothetical protein